MSINSRSIYLFGLWAALTAGAAAGQSFDPPILGAPITDDFGPRKQVQTPTGLSSANHPGIDYGARAGISIHAVETSSVTGIAFHPKKGWFLEVRSAEGRTWTYQHLFVSASTTSKGSGLFRIVQDQDDFIIVRFSDIARTVPVTAFTANGKRAGEKITIAVAGSTRTVELLRSVSAGEAVAPVGRTGRASGPHLHLTLQVDGATRNPLLFLSHAESRFAVTGLLPRPGTVFRPGEIEIRPRVDGSTVAVFSRAMRFLVDSRQGLDLNRVEAYLRSPSGERFRLGQYDYRGAPQSTVSINMAVRPQGADPGLDVFTIPRPAVGAALEDGRYILEVITIDVEGNPSTGWPLRSVSGGVMDGLPDGHYA